MVFPVRRVSGANDWLSERMAVARARSLSSPLCGEERRGGSSSPLFLSPLFNSPKSDRSEIAQWQLVFLSPPRRRRRWRHAPADGLSAAPMMDYDGRATRPVAEAVASSSAPSLQRPAIDEAEAMWKVSMREGEFMESGPYPERPGEIDCAYYLRTGFCRFGMTCRFNHPPNRQMAISAARMKGGYPERVGQPECQFYLKTGTCKFAATCKFHHPRDKAGIVGRVQPNALGYPLRPNEKECAYYLRNGACKFGSTCKYHHPQPSTVVSLRGSAYPTVNSPTSSQQSYPGSLTSWPLPRTSFIASPRWQGPSSYTQLIVPQGLVQVPNWNTLASETNMGVQGDVSQYRPSTFSMGQLAMQKENVFPERPGQPECEFYMKTGDCKFGPVCKFHHPRERLIPIPNCLLSQLGLPLRPGEPLCIFYSRYGICKFGPNCKFDHPMMTPMGVYAYSLATTSSSDVPVMRRLLGSPSGGPPALALSSEAPLQSVTGKSRRLAMSESQSNENIESE